MILNPALALVSINITPNSRDFASPSSIETCLFRQHKHMVKISSAKTTGLIMYNKDEITRVAPVYNFESGVNKKNSIAKINCHEKSRFKTSFYF